MMKKKKKRKLIKKKINKKIKKQGRREISLNFLLAALAKFYCRRKNSKATRVINSNNKKIPWDFQVLKMFVGISDSLETIQQ